MNSAAEWISTGEAARILGVSAATIRRYADEGRLRTRRLPTGIRRVRREDVERMAQEMERES